jgi:predicted O-linked N-acetylglucosamine transferase (SPINDLY family)
MSEASLHQQFLRAVAFYKGGEPSRAQHLCSAMLQRQPGHGGALQLLGVMHAEAGDTRAALAWLDKALQSDPNDALTHSFAGAVHQRLGQLSQALACYDRAVALHPRYAEAWSNRGNVLMELGQPHVALASFARAIAAAPGFAGAYSNHGNALRTLREFEAALASFDAAIALKPDFAEAYSNRANVRSELGQWTAALADYERAIDIQPEFAQAHYNRANLLLAMQRHEAAVTGYDGALALRPDYADAWHNRGNALLQLQRFAAALASYDRALSIRRSFPFLAGIRRHAHMQLCAWAGLEADVAELSSAVEAGQQVTPPFPLLALVDSPRLHRMAACTWARNLDAAGCSLPALNSYPRRERIRIGYFSCDFHDHPVARLMAEVFETHDRRGFEIFAFSFGPEGSPAMRERLARAFERYLDVRNYSERDIALLARSLEVDIAVDLSGFTQGGRPRIFALRAAPVQVSYIGYLGTLAAAHMDYLIADATIVTPADHPHYSEKIICLPSYQANDAKRCMADRPFTRQELHLPASGFVFACFNSTYKIMPATFAGWMRILARVPDSVLFLCSASEEVRDNLRHEAGRQGVAPERLVFGQRLPFAEYLTRYRSVDLVLDTLPYNAGATASDALWAGVPLLTLAGASFAGRIGASLLNAVGLPELIARDQRQYEDLAVELATDPARIDAIKQKLATKRAEAILFDTPRFTAHLECAYRHIYERHHAGLAPDHLNVEHELDVPATRSGASDRV